MSDICHFGKGEEKTLLNTSDARQSQILKLLSDRTFLDLRTLTEHCKVSVATIRRDLSELEQAGKLRRTHGGAVSLDQAAQDPSHAARVISQPAEKAAIAATAADMIADGDAVILDAGTTALEVAKRLRSRSGLTAISNGLDIVSELTRNEDSAVYSVGGAYTETNHSFQGPHAEHFIRQFNVDKLILNASAIDLDRGLIFTATPLNAAIQRAMIEVSNRVIVVADHSKFTKSSLSVTVKIAEVGVVVTDEGARNIIENISEDLRSKFIIADKSLMSNAQQPTAQINQREKDSV